jgi:S-adenosyl-L-methionine hydrolase (adenosine-forming)
MSIVTLTTDWRQNDFYVGAVKGTILRLSPSTNVVDINHQVSPFNISQAAFVVKNAYGFFPEGTIHIVDVSAESSDNKGFIAAKYQGHFFICANNGILGLLFKDDPEIAVTIQSFSLETAPTFAGVSILAPAAALLSVGGKIEELGPVTIDLDKQIPLMAAIDESVISGSVIYIDSYQNAITNITRELFDRIGKGRAFEILVQSNYYRIKKLNQFYNETSPGELLALFNSLELLEIAIYRGNASELLNLGINATIRVKFS